MKGPVRPFSKEVRDLGSRIAKIIENVPQLMVSRLEPVGIRLDTHQASHVVGEIDVPTLAWLFFSRFMSAGYRSDLVQKELGSFANPRET